MRQIVKALFAAAAVLLVTQTPAQIGTVFPAAETRYNSPRPRTGQQRPPKEVLPGRSQPNANPTATPVPTATAAPTATPAPSVTVEEMISAYEKITSDSKAFKKVDGQTALIAKYQDQLGAMFTGLAAYKFAGRPALANQLANNSALAMRKNFGEAANLKNLTQTNEGKQKLFETGLGLLQGALQKDSEALGNSLELLREKNANLSAVMESMQAILVVDPADSATIQTNLASAEEAMRSLKVSRADRERLLATLREVNTGVTAAPPKSLAPAGAANPLAPAPAATPALRPSRVTRKSF